MIPDHVLIRTSYIVYTLMSKQRAYREVPIHTGNYCIKGKEKDWSSVLKNKWLHCTSDTHAR